LPPRVHAILSGLLQRAGEWLAKPFDDTLTAFNLQLIRLADKAPSNAEQNRYFDSVTALKRGRAELAPRLLRHLENALARFDEDAARPAATRALPAKPSLALSDETPLDEELVLTDMAVRIETREREPLYTLGCRFGVLAGAPRIAAEALPVGPRALTEALRHAAAVLDIELAHRVVLYQCFERVVLRDIGGFYRAINGYLIEQGILPHLHASPQLAAARAAARAIPTATARRAPAAAAPAKEPVPAAAERTPPPQAAAPARVAADAEDFFATLRRLLAAHRLARLHVVGAEELQRALAVVQSHRADAEAHATPYTGEELREQILAVLRPAAAPERTYRFDEADGDTIDLIARLIATLVEDVPADGIVRRMLVRLQVPVLRVALRDKSFFTDKTHPARQWLDAVVEAGRAWVDETEGEADAELGELLQQWVARIAADQANATARFAEATTELAQRLETATRKSEAAERRRVEAARGREKLELARTQALAAVAARLAAARPGRLLQALLEGAWTDALMLSLLRDGEASLSYARRLAVVDELLGHAAEGEAGPERAAPVELRNDLHAGLSEVGLPDEEIQAVLQRLFGATAAGAEPGLSLTELLIRLRHRTRRDGEETGAPVTPAPPPDAAPLAPAEHEALHRVLALPAGAWFAFAVDGRRVRRKLAWYSPQTRQCLFVNRRGVPVAGASLDELARQLARGAAHFVDPAESPVERAWSRVVAALKAGAT
jgi:hypothetical protein